MTPTQFYLCIAAVAALQIANMAVTLYNRPRQQQDEFADAAQRSLRDGGILSRLVFDKGSAE